MATLHLRCPRCGKARPLVAVPIVYAANKVGRPGVLCWKCVGEVQSLQQKPKVVEK